MRTRYKILEPGQPYFLTATIVQWLPVFTRKSYLDAVLDGLTFYRQNKGLKLFAYVILDNHIHLVAAA
jgi:REP element-mobilizing transposase RayT